MTINTLKNKTVEWQMNYHPFKFPLSTRDDALVFSFGSSDQLCMLSKDGMTYLLYRLGKYVDRGYAKSLYREDKQKFVEYLNTCRNKQVNTELWRKNQILILAENKGIVWGVLTNYNPKSNQEVLNDIEQDGLISSITRWNITQKEMNIYFKHCSQDGITVGLNVRNGETGHATLSYRLYVEQGEYTFSTPEFGKRRHMSTMIKVDESLKNAYKDIQDIKLHDFLSTQEAKEYTILLTEDEKFDKLVESLQPYNTRLRKVTSLLAFLSSKREERGWKTVCDKALNKVYTMLLEKMNNA